jgi:hypothetical protein
MAIIADLDQVSAAVAGDDGDLRLLPTTQDSAVASSRSGRSAMVLRRSRRRRRCADARVAAGSRGGTITLEDVGTEIGPYDASGGTRAWPTEGWCIHCS